MNNQAESVDGFSLSPGGGVKLIVFMIADYYLALPISNVLKVVNYPSENNGKLRAAGLVQIGQHTFTLLDLHRKLQTRDSLQLTMNSPFLVVAQSSQELYGIPVDDPPNLAEFPQESIQALPKSYQQNGPLSMASHVANLNQEDKTFTVFFLDIERALNTNTSSNTPRLITVEQ